MAKMATWPVLSQLYLIVMECEGRQLELYVVCVERKPDQAKVNANPSIWQNEDLEKSIGQTMLTSISMT